MSEEINVLPWKGRIVHLNNISTSARSIQNEITQELEAVWS